MMKRLGLISLLGLALVAAPGAARAAGWGAGGGYYAQPVVVPAPVPRYAVPAPVVVPAPGPRYAAPAPVWRTQTVPTYAAPRARVWVPGHYGLRDEMRVWVGGTWSYPPFAGWVWTTPRWAWNGYQWVWQEGTWSPPY